MKVLVVYCHPSKNSFTHTIKESFIRGLEDAGEVDAIYVLSEYYGRKVGYRLMNEAISRLSKYDTFFVWVFEKNERAIDFYHKYGFEFDGCKKEWTLGTPVTIVRMVMKRE